MPARATFKPQLTIPESPGLLTDERGEMRREQIMAREQAELEREERERRAAEAAARALAHSTHHTHPQRRELTVPESPAFLTRDRANARRELLDSINEHREASSRATASDAPTTTATLCARRRLTSSSAATLAPQREPASSRSSRFPSRRRS
jgi:hypothetical protein